MKDSEKYTISLDIGEASVGWAVLSDFKLVKKNKKINEIKNGEHTNKKQRTNMWGARLFDEASTAQERRLKRSGRRRIVRKTKRLRYLREIFEPHIQDIDSNFFHKLDESFLSYKDENKKYYVDSDIYNAFPTIYHLRNHLMTSDEKADIRLIYLALHHICKYRGHFVNQGQDFDMNNVNVIDGITALKGALDNIEKQLSSTDFTQLNSVLTNRQWSKSKKVFETKTEGWEKALYTAMVGNGIDLAKIFDNPDYSQKENADIPKAGDFKFSLDADKYEEKLNTLANILTDQELEVISLAKNVYESIVLCNILSKPTLSLSMIEKYETHKEQLKKLKSHLKDDRESYEKVFGKDGIYTKYVNHESKTKVTSREDFYKKMKDLLPNLCESNEIKQSLEFEAYLPKQRYRDNGAIPYQIHKHELETIIKKQSKHYPWLMKDLENGYEEGYISKLAFFRIPYYVGPLARNHEHSVSAWIAKKTDKVITPWNFDQVVDKEASATNFIERMTAFCTYFPEEKVLPKNSLTYQEFSIYNELISSGWEEGKHKKYFLSNLRQAIVEELFKKQKKVTAENMCDFLNNNSYTADIGVKQLFGIDTVVKEPKYNNSYSTYIDLIRCGLTDQDITNHKERFETIIRWATILEDRDMREKRLNDTNTDEWENWLNPKQIKALAKLRYTGWGRLSKKLLDGIKHSNGKTILENLKNEPYNNFMRLLEDENISQKIKAAQLKDKNTESLSYGLVEDLAGSPALKKGIWQSLQIIKELEQFLGKDNIGKIVIEMARGPSGGRNTTRQKQIEKFYKTWKDKTGEQLGNIEDIFKGVTNPKDFDNEKVFLYFLQNGKCMYTKETLELGSLSNYEVDHIIPQSYIKDDSFSNKVLVSKSANQNKGGDVPSQDIILKMSEFWHFLAENGQVSPKKLANLKKGKLTENDKMGFINRQLVETRQITKHVANILSDHFAGTDTEILTPKAGLTSQFRKTFDMPKNREINDHHHAHDAYLNAIVATYVYKARPDLKKAWVYGEYQRGYEKNQRKEDKFLKSLLDGMKEDNWIDLENGAVFAKKQEVIADIKKTLNYRNVNVVKKTEKQTGKFGDESVYSADAKKIPVKKHLPEKIYGGTSAPISAFAVLKRDKKGKIKPESITAMKNQAYKKQPGEIVVTKHTKYQLPNGTYRLMASYQEAQNGQQIKTFVMPTEKSNENEFEEAFDKLAEFIVKNKLFIDKNINNIKAIKNQFLGLSVADVKNDKDDKDDKDDKGKLVYGKLSVIKNMVDVANGSNQGLKALKQCGLSALNQRLTSGNTITDGTTLIYQSPTGLYETRKTL